MPFCKNCGTKHDEGDTFCVKCGAALSSGSPTAPTSPTSPSNTGTKPWESSSQSASSPLSSTSNSNSRRFYASPDFLRFCKGSYLINEIWGTIGAFLLYIGLDDDRKSFKQQSFSMSTFFLIIAIIGIISIILYFALKKPAAENVYATITNDKVILNQWTIYYNTCVAIDYRKIVDTSIISTRGFLWITSYDVLIINYKEFDGSSKLGKAKVPVDQAHTCKQLIDEKRKSFI